MLLAFGASRGEEAARLEEIIKVFNEKTGYNVVMEDFFTVLQEKKICLILTKWNWKKSCSMQILFRHSVSQKEAGFLHCLQKKK